MADNLRIIASCLILNRNNELLLLRRHRQARGGGYWAPPGGKLEADEALEAAIVREVLEETGISLPTPLFLGYHDVHMPHGSARMATFKSVLPARPQVVLNPDEHEGHVWHDVQTVANRQTLIWGLPTILHDFGIALLDGADPTLEDGSQVVSVVY